MNILVIGDNTWDDTNALGNTLSNFFDQWPEANFSYLYTRATPPRNAVCRRYYAISHGDLLKNFFRPARIGRSFTYDPTQAPAPGNAGAKEKKAIFFIHKYNLKLAYLAEDFLWESGKWRNRQLDRFIEETAPDILFAFAIGSSCIARSIAYIRQKTGAKLVLFIADDVHGQYQRDHSHRGRRMIAALARLIAAADRLYGASRQLSEHYTALYDKPVPTLYKGCDLSLPTKAAENRPIRLVYAGNLLYGRDKTLAQLAQALEHLNADDEKAQLEIYSGTAISEECRRQLERPGATFMGQRDYEEIKQILHAADIVLHIESFDPAQIALVRHSFSTKIIDCLQSGSVLMVIGPAGIASVEYPREIPGAIVISDTDHITAALREVVAAPETLVERANAIRAFALQHHEISQTRHQLQQELAALAQRPAAPTE